MSERTEQLERTRDALDAANERMAATEADVQLTLDEVTATVTGLSLFLFLRRQQYRSRDYLWVSFRFRVHMLL